MYISQSAREPTQVGEDYVADVMWNGQLYRMELTSEGVPDHRELAEQLQTEYPGSIVQRIYPVEKNPEVKIADVKRYHPSKLEWVD